MEVARRVIIRPTGVTQMRVIVLRLLFAVATLGALLLASGASDKWL